MRLRRPTLPLLFLLAFALLALGAFVAGCGDDDQTNVSEGEALVLDGMTYNIQDTRALNPYSAEDSTYLVGAPKLQHGQEYLAVFMKVDNDGDQANVIPGPLRIIDTRGTIYDQTPMDNPYSLVTGTPILPGDSLPGPETAAANGPIKGSMILFIIDQDANENRPLILQVPGASGVGTIELDL